MASTFENGARGQKSRIFLVDDHPVFRNGLAKLLKDEDDFTVCGEAGDATLALRCIAKLKPDLAIVDLWLPGMSGWELIKSIRVLRLATKLLVVSMFDEALYADKVMRAGGDGYIMKQASSQEILSAIREVLAGHIYVSDEGVAKRLADRPTRNAARALDQLTDSELEVLELLGQGKDLPEISHQLDLTQAEVKTDIKNIRRRLKFKTMNSLIQYAVIWVGGGCLTAF